MTGEEIKKRFVNEIKLRAYDDKYVDKNEEREILQIAIQMGVGIDQARRAMAQVCADCGYVLESGVLDLIKDQVELAAGGDGRLDRKTFDAILDRARAAVLGKKNDRQIKTLIVQVMEDTGYNKVKTGWFSNWYAVMKKDLGL